MCGWPRIHIIALSSVSISVYKMSMSRLKIIGFCKTSTVPKLFFFCNSEFLAVRLHKLSAAISDLQAVLTLSLFSYFKRHLRSPISQVARASTRFSQANFGAPLYAYPQTQRNKRHQASGN